MEELTDKLRTQKCLLDEEKRDAVTRAMEQSDKLIDRILQGTFCKQCRRAIRQGKKPDHIVVVNQWANEKDCQHVSFQRWVDFVVANKETLSHDEAYMVTLKGVLVNFIEQCNSYLPNIEWHYTRLFNEAPVLSRPTALVTLDKVEEPKECPLVPEQPVCLPQPLPEQHDRLPPVVAEGPGSDFLCFFRQFFQNEYNCNVDDITLFSHLENDLFMDTLGYVNFGDALCEEYPDQVQAAFGKLLVPLTVFQRHTTVFDIFYLLRKGEKRDAA